MPSDAPSLLTTYEPGALLPGTPYRVLRRIGQGGMGVVYAVLHTFLRRVEAVKTIRPELVDERHVKERVAQEATVLGNLRHPNIVQVTGGGVLNDAHQQPFFAMEMLHGKNLREVLRAGALLDTSSICTVARCILSALAEAHAAGIVHRDVKPENIFLHCQATRAEGAQVTPKLLDFGVMALSGGKNSAFRGTYRYAAPEQLRGEPATPETDVYAMALVVFEMLAGRGPFDDVRGARDLVRAHLETEAPRVSDFARVHPAVDDVIARALSKNAAERPRSAIAFAADLRLLELLPGAAVPASEPFLAALAEGLASGATEAESAPPAPEPTRNDTHPAWDTCTAPSSPADGAREAKPVASRDGARTDGGCSVEVRLPTADAGTSRSGGAASLVTQPSDARRPTARSGARVLFAGLVAGAVLGTLTWLHPQDPDMEPPHGAAAVDVSATEDASSPESRGTVAPSAKPVAPPPRIDPPRADGPAGSTSAFTERVRDAGCTPKPKTTPTPPPPPHAASAPPSAPEAEDAGEYVGDLKRSFVH